MKKRIIYSLICLVLIFSFILLVGCKKEEEIKQTSVSVLLVDKDGEEIEKITLSSIDELKEELNEYKIENDIKEFYKDKENKEVINIEDLKFENITLYPLYYEKFLITLEFSDGPTITDQIIENEDLNILFNKYSIDIGLFNMFDEDNNVFSLESFNENKTDIRIKLVKKALSPSYNDFSICFVELKDKDVFDAYSIDFTVRTFSIKDIPRSISNLSNYDYSSSWYFDAELTSAITYEEIISMVNNGSNITLYKEIKQTEFSLNLKINGDPKIKSETIQYIRNDSLIDTITSSVIGVNQALILDNISILDDGVLLTENEFKENPKEDVSIILNYVKELDNQKILFSGAASTSFGVAEFSKNQVETYQFSSSIAMALPLSSESASDSQYKLVEFNEEGVDQLDMQNEETDDILTQDNISVSGFRGYKNFSFIDFTYTNEDFALFSMASDTSEDFLENTSEDISLSYIMDNNTGKMFSTEEIAYSLLTKDSSISLLSDYSLEYKFSLYKEEGMNSIIYFEGELNSDSIKSKKGFYKLIVISPLSTEGSAQLVLEPIMEDTEIDAYFYLQNSLNVNSFKYQIDNNGIFYVGINGTDLTFNNETEYVYAFFADGSGAITREEYKKGINQDNIFKAMDGFVYINDGMNFSKFTLANGEIVLEEVDYTPLNFYIENYIIDSNSNSNASITNSYKIFDYSSGEYNYSCYYGSNSNDNIYFNWNSDNYFMGNPQKQFGIVYYILHNNTTDTYTSSQISITELLKKNFSITDFSIPSRREEYDFMKNYFISDSILITCLNNGSDTSYLIFLDLEKYFNSETDYMEYKKLDGKFEIYFFDEEEKKVYVRNFINNNYGSYVDEKYYADFSAGIDRIGYLVNITEEPVYNYRTVAIVSLN